MKFFPLFFLMVLGTGCDDEGRWECFPTVYIDVSFGDGDLVRIVSEEEIVHSECPGDYVDGRHANRFTVNFTIPTRDRLRFHVETCSGDLLLMVDEPLELTNMEYAESCGSTDRSYKVTSLKH